MILSISEVTNSTTISMTLLSCSDINVTDFYEYGWGQSFHFANRFHDETLAESIQRHESYLALKMNLKAGDKVLDLDCDVGGSLRRIAHLTGTHVTDITISVSANCQFIQGDFMKLPFEDNSFDHVYTIEAAKCFAEVIHVLKPGGSLVGYDWCFTDKYDSQNCDHVETKRLIEEGDALPDLKSTYQLVADLKSVGFTIAESRIIPEGDISWYQPLKDGDSFFTLNNFRTSFLGPAQGSLATLNILETARDGIIRGGESVIFTRYFFFLARKS
ncbi:unnamed protein product [Rotaria sp. Silwood1]|nr:unnamed protein product [Rotaria sp. Silwood1]CAF4893069.1 unnamed protein product [Rotaria sp. Silwood1]